MAIGNRSMSIPKYKLLQTSKTMTFDCDSWQLLQLLNNFGKNILSIWKEEKRFFHLKVEPQSERKKRTEYGIKIDVDYKRLMNWKSTDVTKKKSEKFVSVSVCSNWKPGIKAYQHQTSSIKFNFCFFGELLRLDSVTSVWYADLAEGRKTTIRSFATAQIRHSPQSLAINYNYLNERKKNWKNCFYFISHVCFDFNQRKKKKQNKNLPLNLYAIHSNVIYDHFISKF